MKEFIAHNFVPVTGCIMMFTFVLLNKGLSKRKRHFFAFTLALFMLSLVLRNADYITSCYEHFTIRRAVYSAFGYVVRSLVIYALIGTDFNLKKKKIRNLYFLLGLPILITIFSAFSIFFTDKVYSFTETNNFRGGPLSWLNYVPLAIYMIVIVAIAVYDFCTKRYRHGRMIVGTLTLMTFAMCFEYFGFREFLSECAITMALMLYLFFFQNDEHLNESKHLKKKALTDGLTGLYNRNGYNEIMKNYSKDKDLMVAMMVLDIDGFKSVNDTYGHDIGDCILKNMAKLLSITFRSTDYVIRYGGDEFVVIMIGITENLGFVVKNKVESINVQMLNPISNIPKTSVSAGLAFSENGLSEELFKQADEALYMTKTTTKHGCTIYGVKEDE